MYDRIGNAEAPKGHWLPNTSQKTAHSSRNKNPARETAEAGEVGSKNECFAASENSNSTNSRKLKAQLLLPRAMSAATPPDYSAHLASPANQVDLEAKSYLRRKRESNCGISVNKTSASDRSTTKARFTDIQRSRGMSARAGSAQGGPAQNRRGLLGLLP